MRTMYEDYSSVTGNVVETKYNQSNNNSQNSAIPYHARENSLPFSYGQIGKTSTPLRSTTTTISRVTNSINPYNSNDYNFDIDYCKNDDINKYAIGKATDGSFNVNNTTNDRNYNMDKGMNYNTNNKDNDTSGIKTQPRLTSPLLVRKTLASRSPTRSSNANTNTISNIYSFEKSNVSYNVNSNGMNGNDVSASYNNNSNHINNNSNSNKNGYSGYGGGLNGSNGYKTYANGSENIYGNTLRKTPIRDDFENLLHERRERVFNEYRSKTNDKLITTKATPPEPPQRQYLPSRSYTKEYFNSNTNGLSTSNNKYNYDFEFNLNLDEVDLAVTPPRRVHTMERSSLQQYRTKDIPMPSNNSISTKPTSSYIERNYHTISSSGINSYRENGPYGENGNERPALNLDAKVNSSANEFSLYRQKNAISPLPPQHPQLSQHQQRQQQYKQQYKQQPEQQHQLQHGNIKKEEHLFSSTTYGNENLSTLNNTTNSNVSNTNNKSNNISSNNNIYNGNNSRNELLNSPIYATSTKQVTTIHSTSNNTSGVNNNNNNINSNTIQRSNRLTEQDLTNMEYFYNTNVNTTLGSPTSPYGTRPETPAFPVTPRTPFGMNNGQPVSILKQSSPSPQRVDSGIGHSPEINTYNSETIYHTTFRPRLNSSLSMANSEPQEVAAHLVKFAKDSSKFWYKPNISREEAISLLLNAPPGTFLIRDSTTFKNAYGLVLRVAQPPPGTTSNKPDELVRHFLIEPTTRGVRLKGCANEPVFTSLSALVYEHSINQLALPCLLRIPEEDVAPPLIEPTPAQKQLLTQGAACNVLYLYSCDTESLTGEEAIRKAIRQLYASKPLPTPTEVHFKVSQQGITLTDNTRKKFFRKHYAADMISFCAIDPDHRLWTLEESTKEDDVDDLANTSTLARNAKMLGSMKKTIFAFVARRTPSSKDNQCHVFCDLTVTQPASAIVSFANKTLPTEKQNNYVL